MAGVSFENDRGLKLKSILDGEGNKCVVLCSHFTGFKEFKHLHNLAKSLEAEGIAALRFDYSDCIGASEGSCEDMALTHQIRDTFSAIDFVQSKGFNTVGLFGHSLGGTTAIVTAANDNRVKALVSAAAPATPAEDELFKKHAEEWKKQRFITFPSWKKEIKIKYAFYEDLKRYNAAEIIKQVSIPILVIQPKNDELVSMWNAEEIYKNAAGEKKLEIVSGDHMFSGENEQKMIDATVNWFKKWL